MADIETTNINETNENRNEQTTEQSGNVGENESAELKRLKAELAKQKAALDKATKEAGDYRKQLRARQTEEEAAAEEKRLADEERDRKLAEYEKRFTVAETSKKIFAFVRDEAAANSIAESLYGAEDADAAIAEFTKAWTAREKALRLEYGKIPAPGTGASDGAMLTRAQLDAMSYTDRLKFATENPAEYSKLMGR